MTVTVIIPTYKPGAAFRRLMKKLSTQTYPIEKIIIMNTEEQYWKNALIQGIEQAEVHHITNGCEPPCSSWVLNSGALKEQSVLLNAEPSLQPLFYYFKAWVGWLAWVWVLFFETGFFLYNPDSSWNSLCRTGCLELTEIHLPLPPEC